VAELLLTLLLAAHLLCVNVASGGPLLGAWLDWRGTRGDGPSARAAVYLARASLIALIAGAALGLLIGWLKWDADYRALWTGPLSYKLTGATIEALFSLVLMLIWWLWLPGNVGGRKRAMAARSLVAILAATNLLYHFPLLFSVAADLQDRGLTTGPTIGGAAFRQLIRADTAAMAVHVAFASLAMAGMLLMGLALRWLRQGEAENAAAMGRAAARWALVPSLLQLSIVVWMLISLRPEVQAQLMGQSAVDVLLFIAALVAMLWLLNDLAQLSLGEFTRRLAIRAMIAMLVTVVLMTAMQQQTRIKVGQTFLSATKRQ